MDVCTEGTRRKKKVGRGFVMEKKIVCVSQKAPVAICCVKCMRIVAYRISTGSGSIQIKCPKCGEEMIVDLSCRKRQGQRLYRKSTVSKE